MSNHPCGLCGELHFGGACPPCPNHEAGVFSCECKYCDNARNGYHDHDNYAIIICDPKRGHTARDCEGFTTSINEAHEVMRDFHDEVVVKNHQNPLGQLKSFAFYYRKGVLVAVIAPSKKVDR